jgi:DNA-binding MarR family transcriptional regulator
MSVEAQLDSASNLDLFKKVILNLMYTGSWLSEKSSEFFKEYDLTSPQFNVLRILRGQNDNPVNLQDIQTSMISRMSNTTRLIEKLRLKNLVTRVQCESNRRKIEIKITQTGLDLLEEIDKTLCVYESRTTKNLSKEEAIILNELLNKLRINTK